MTSRPQRRATGTADGPARNLDAVLRELRAAASEQFRVDQEKRYGIVTKDERYGTPMAKIKAAAKTLGRDHAFAEALWRTRVYEARLLATMVAEPDALTAAQMDRWVEDCDNWAVVDTLCFNLFDRSPHAFARIAKWSKANDEFVKRAAFALLACMAVHRRGDDADFLAALPLVERAATDPRNFVKKGVNWALRAIGVSKRPRLRTEQHMPWHETSPSRMTRRRAGSARTHCAPSASARVKRPFVERLYERRGRG